MNEAMLKEYYEQSEGLYSKSTLFSEYRVYVEGEDPIKTVRDPNDCDVFCDCCNCFCDSGNWKCFGIIVCIAIFGNLANGC